MMPSFIVGSLELVRSFGFGVELMGLEDELDSRYDMHDALRMPLRLAKQSGSMKLRSLR